MTCKYGVFFFFLINSAMIFLLSVPSHFFEGMKEKHSENRFFLQTTIFFFFSFLFVFVRFFNFFKQKKNCLNIFLHPLLTFLLWYQTKSMIHNLIFFFNFLLTIFLYLQIWFFIFLYFLFFLGTFYPVDRVL